MGNLIKILVLVFCSFSSIGQISFYNIYTNNGSDKGQGVVQLEDSSYVITGASSSFSGSSQAFLLHVDSLGNYLWSNNYGGAESESGRRVLYKKNFGFFICGFTNSIGSGGFDNYLAKVNESGVLEWEKAYGGSGWERVHDAALTKDTGVIMVGETSSNLTDNQDIYIVRTNKFGDTLWTKTIGGLGDDYASTIKGFTDSTFVIAGRTYVEDSLLTKIYITYIKDNGTVIWTDTLGNLGNYWANGISFNGNQILGVGGCVDDFSDGTDLVAFIYDISGFYWGESKIPAAGNQNFDAITGYGSSNNIYTCYSNEDAGSYVNGPDVIVAKYTSLFGWQSSFRIGYQNPDVTGQIIKTSDGGAIVVGYSTGIIAGGNEVFLVKIGPNDDYPSSITDLVMDELVILNEEAIALGLKIYPNPSNNIINIAIDNANFNQIKLVNSLGKQIYAAEFQKSTKIDVSNFESGLYFIEISGTNVTAITRQVVIK